MVIYIRVNIGSGNKLIPDGIKLMLTDRQWDYVALT